MQLKEKEMKVFETELKLLVNQRLFDKKAITEEMYIKAKEMILKGGLIEVHTKC